MSRWKQFHIAIIKVSEEELDLPGGPEEHVTDVMIDLDEVESFYRSLKDEDKIDRTRVGLKSGDAFVVLEEYSDFKKIMQEAK